MSGSRQAIPRAIRDQVLGEYNHLCAICRAPKPQVHHIDGDHSNNDPLNLLPLCPNHHLGDQHNPTGIMDPARVLLFRRHKDPTVLWPQFAPLFSRLRFLDNLDPALTDAVTLKANAEELVDFVAALEMGDFYSKRLRDLVKPLTHVRAFSLDTPRSEFERWRREEHAEHLQKLRENREEALRLAIELLRYQNWQAPATGI